MPPSTPDGSCFSVLFARAEITARGTSLSGIPPGSMSPSPAFCLPPHNTDRDPSTFLCGWSLFSVRFYCESPLAMYPSTYMSHILPHVCLDPAAVLSIDYDYLVTTAGIAFADEVWQFEVGVN